MTLPAIAWACSAASVLAQPVPYPAPAPAPAPHVLPPLAAASVASASPAAPAAYRLQPLEVELNGLAVGTWLMLEQGGIWHASEQALDDWRVRPPGKAHAVRHRDEAWYPLHALQGYRSQLDPAKLLLTIQFSAEAFKLTRLQPHAEQAPPLSPSEWASFMNYDLALSQSRSTAANGQSLSSMVELGVTSPHGVWTSTHVVRRHSAGLATAAQADGWTRLETTYTRDITGADLTLRVGDSHTSGAVDSRALYFGGVQLGRNFGLRPGFGTQPIPFINGAATSPSVVELYVNNALRMVSSVPSGPFSVQDPSMLATDGQVRLVLRDVLGRETVVTQSVFGHPQLLSPGLTDWSVEAGAVRYGLGEASANYGPRFASGHWRAGLTQNLTGQAHAQWSREVQGLRLGAVAALPAGWLVEANGAHSQSGPDVGAGQAWQLRLQRDASGQGLQWQSAHSSPGYRVLGQTGPMYYKRQHMWGYHVRTSDQGGAALVITRVLGHDASRMGTASLTYSHRLGRGHLSLSLTDVQGSRTGKMASAMWVMPLGAAPQRLHSHTSVNHTGGRTDAVVGLQRNASPEQPLGWRALAGTPNGQNKMELGVHQQSAHMAVQGELTTVGGQQHARIGLQGAVVGMGGHTFFTRPVQSSFALVEVPGLPELSVGLHGQHHTRTNAQGLALLTQLQAYNHNPVRLDPNQLPMGAEVESIEINAVPAWRSAVRVRFPVRQGRSALLTLQLDNGEPVPAGAQVGIDGEAGVSFHVARRGQAFVSGLQPRNHLTVSWKHQTCRIPVTLPASSADDIIRLPTMRCVGMQP